MLKTLLGLCLLAAPAIGDSEVRPLAQTNGAWVVSPPELAKDLDARIAADMKLRPIDPTTKKPVTKWTCEVGLMTDAFVSWACVGRSGDDFGMAGPGVHRAFAIKDGKLVPYDLLPEVTSKELLEQAFAANNMTGCDLLRSSWGATPKSLFAYPAPEAAGGCNLEWWRVYRVLRTESVLARAVRAVPATQWQGAFLDHMRTISSKANLPEARSGKPAAGRFVAEGDYGVKDTQTGLVWVAKEDPTEVDADGARAIAARYRGGGHTDWRLPSIDELTALATPDVTHAEPGDCTGGKSKYTITPLIHLSCGLAWSMDSTNRYDEWAAFGFISGTGRLAKGSESKNYRALLVRGP